MKKMIAATVTAAALLVVTGAATARAGVNLSVNIGVPVVAPVSPPVVAASYPGGDWPVAQPQIYLDEPPRFIYSPNLGFHVSVGTPYDIAYLNNGYYLYRGGNWYLAPSYTGPWSVVSYRRLPPLLHKHRYDQIRHYRDYEYRSYLRDRDHYRGSWYQPTRVKHRIEHRDHWDGRRERWDGRGGRWDRDGRGDGRRDHDRRDR